MFVLIRVPLYNLYPKRVFHFLKRAELIIVVVIEGYYLLFSLVQYWIEQKLNELDIMCTSRIRMLDISILLTKKKRTFKIAL